MVMIVRLNVQSNADEIERRLTFNSGKEVQREAWRRVVMGPKSSLQT